MIGAVVPVKTLPSSKSRLRPWLDGYSVERLSIAMLSDILETLRQVRAIDRIAVATPDPRIAEVAHKVGAEVLSTSVVGLNPSIEAACEVLAPTADDAALVVLGDVAGAQAADIEALLDAGARRGVVLAPSNDGGTSALLRTPRDTIPAAFGPNSARAHRELAESAGISFEELALPSLAIDIDERADLEKFASSAFAGTRTRALLRELLPDLAT
ncbi:MAG: 2-phospho-L-lactate guanylyltransferase [Deltaproteobacteria bacterium]|nr:2-phospho-L-lactate guanylyltransferase [Deltaproteobacteria bacterium]MBW2578924.1 2-phospho-L-lactate guanylyltransferase [Deltaproteobacteria bacterium]MBW2694392.1 2-phospho-L-lactate guanylyltransferase [Deltaproteobacteria bacterium]